MFIAFVAISASHQQKEVTARRSDQELGGYFSSIII
jgi:hypothetical protein